jgi:hypothetical protein
MFPLKSSLKQTKQASKQTTTTRNPEQQQPKKTMAISFLEHQFY